MILFFLDLIARRSAWTARVRCAQSDLTPDTGGGVRWSTATFR